MSVIDEVRSLNLCSVVMPAQVELRVGDDLQFEPQEWPLPTEPGSEWDTFCKSRLGKLARIIKMSYSRDPALISAPLDAGAMYLNLYRLMLKVRFQDEQELHEILAIHFVNHAPRPSSF